MLATHHAGQTRTEAVQEEVEGEEKEASREGRLGGRNRVDGGRGGREVREDCARSSHLGSGTEAGEAEEAGTSTLE